MNNLSNGATLWSRNTIQSEIFFLKPPEWFKIWFYIVSKVNHTKNSLFNRGTGFFNFQEEKRQLRVSDDQIKKCLHYLRKCKMVATTRSTRGNIITVLNYNLYQDIDSYRSTTKSTREAREKHERSTPINKNDKNEKNDNNINTIADATNLRELSDIVGRDHITKEYQAYGLEIFNILCAPPSKKSEFIRIARDFPRDNVDSALSFARDYPVSAIRWKMFFKKLYSLRKNVQS